MPRVELHRVVDVHGSAFGVAEGPGEIRGREGPKVDKGVRWEPADVGAAVRGLIAKAVPPQKVYGT